uniref:Protein FAM32A n=1 Tax=Strigamia maritima TaxID=126957 RepID=T1JHZ6_STRMM
MAEYEVISKSSLKLKGIENGGIKKKKKKTKESQEKMDRVTNNNNPQEFTVNLDEAATSGPPQHIYRTKAQQAFDKMQHKRQMQRIIQKASKTHKQRVEEFNNHLDQLTEHYDIPKVSWTK